MEGQSNKWESQRGNNALPKLEDIIKCKRLSWLGHLSRMDHHRLPQQALTWEPEGFRRRQGSTATELERCRQERYQENGYQLGRGWRGCGGQEEMEESCRPMHLWRMMNHEPGTKSSNSAKLLQLNRRRVKRPRQNDWNNFSLTHFER